MNPETNRRGLSLFWDCPRIIPNASKKGFVLTVTLIFLVVVLIIVIAFLDMIRVHLTSTTYRTNREKGVYLAEAGAEQKLLELKLDLINSASNIYDAFNETWAQGIGDTNGSLNDSEGVSLDSGKYQVLKGFIDGATPPDTFQNLMDEQGKININYANSLTLSNLLRMTNPGMPKSDAIFKAGKIVSYRYGADGKPGVANNDDDNDGQGYFLGNLIDDDGVNGVDDDGEKFLGIEYDGMDNDDDGIIDYPADPSEGIDEPDEFKPNQPYGDDNPFDNIEEFKKVPEITETDYNNVKDYITVYSGVNSNSPYANNTNVSNNYKYPYALAPRITRSAVPRAPVNINTASLPVLKVVLWNEDVTPIGTPPAVITLVDADSIARSVINERAGGDNIHGNSNDTPFNSIGGFENFIDSLYPGPDARESTIKDNANPSACSNYNYGYYCYTTEFFFFFTGKINEDIISSNTYDGGTKDKFYFTSKAFLIQASGEISGTGGAKAKPELTVVVER